MHNILFPTTIFTTSKNHDFHRQVIVTITGLPSSPNTVITTTITMVKSNRSTLPLPFEQIFIS
jgi:hypothetical protein